MRELSKKQEFEIKRDYIQKKLGPSKDYVAVYTDLTFAGIYNDTYDAKKAYIDILLFMVKAEVKPYIPFYSDFKLPWSKKLFFDQLEVKGYKYVLNAGGGEKAPEVKKRPAKRAGEVTTTIMEKPKKIVKEEVKRSTVSDTLEVIAEEIQHTPNVLDQKAEEVKVPITNMEKGELRHLEVNDNLSITIRTLRGLKLDDVVYKVISVIEFRKLELENELESINKFLRENEE